MEMLSSNGQNQYETVKFVGPFDSPIHGQYLTVQELQPIAWTELSEEIKLKRVDYRVFQFWAHGRHARFFYAEKLEDIPLHMICIPPYAIPADYLSL